MALKELKKQKITIKELRFIHKKKLAEKILSTFVLIEMLALIHISIKLRSKFIVVITFQHSI